MPKRVDQNQAGLARFIRRLGALWIPTSGDPAIGFDGLIAFKGNLLPVEIKNPALSPSRRCLTPTEARRKGELESAGATLYVVQTEQDVLNLLRACNTAG